MPTVDVGAGAEASTVDVGAGAEADDPSGRAATGGASRVRDFADWAAAAARAAASAVSRATDVGTGSARSPRVRLRVVSGISAGATGSSLSTGAGASSGGTGTPVTRDRGASAGNVLTVGDALKVGNVAATPAGGAGVESSPVVDVGTDAGATGETFPSAVVVSGSVLSAADSTFWPESLSAACFAPVMAAGAITDEAPPRRRTRCSAMGADDWLTASWRSAETSVSVSGA
jgi:hypothetical protein